MRRQSFPSNFNKEPVKRPQQRKMTRRAFVPSTRWSPSSFPSASVGWASKSMPAEFSKEYTNMPWRWELQVHGTVPTKAALARGRRNVLDHICVFFQRALWRTGFIKQAVYFGNPCCCHHVQKSAHSVWMGINAECQKKSKSEN